MVRAFAHGVMGRRIDPSWGGPIELFLVPASQCSTTGVTKAVICVMLTVVHTDIVAHVAAAGFPSRYLNGPLPYV